MTGHNYSEESNIFTAAAVDPGIARRHSLALILSYQEGKQRRDDGLYIHPVSTLSQLHTYIVIMGNVWSVSQSHGPYRIVATRDSCFYEPKSIKTEQGWKCTGSTTTPLLQYIFAVQDLQHAVLYFLVFGAAGKLPSEASKSKWIMIISMSLYVWYKLKSVKFTWKTIHEYCN